MQLLELKINVLRAGGRERMVVMLGEAGEGERERRRERRKMQAMPPQAFHEFDAMSTRVDDDS